MKITMYFPDRRCAPCTGLLSYSERHLRILLLQLRAALFQFRVNSIPLFVSIPQPWVCDIPGALLQDSKTRDRQDIRAETQLVSAVAACAVPVLSEFYSLVVSIWQPWVFAIRGAQLRSTARIQRDIGADCRAECVLILGFNAQSDIIAVMIAWS